MIGVLRLAVAVCVAIVLSQFPAFSDQYVQRLGGQVDALTRVAADFDASAEGAGLTRDQALEWFRHETLTPSRHVQTPEAILADTDAFAANNAAMQAILERFFPPAA